MRAKNDPGRTVFDQWISTLDSPPVQGPPLPSPPNWLLAKNRFGKGTGRHDAHAKQVLDSHRKKMGLK